VLVAPPSVAARHLPRKREEEGMVGYTFPRLRGKYPEGGMGGAAGAYLKMDTCLNTLYPR